MSKRSDQLLVEDILESIDKLCIIRKKIKWGYQNIIKLSFPY